MSLPLQVVERLSARLSATDGRDFVSKFEGVDPNAVKSSWAHKLSRFEGDLPSIAWALESVPERASNVIEFRAICRRAAMPEVVRIERCAASREWVAAELQKMRPVLRACTAHRGNRYWARRIVAKGEGGGKVTPAALSMARDALGSNEVVEAA